MRSQLPPDRRRYQGEVLRPLLEARSLSQRALADRLDTPAEDVSRWCNGHQLLTTYWIVRLRVVLRLGDEETVALVHASARLDYERRLWHYEQGA